jgi:hypothetical protein
MTCPGCDDDAMEEYITELFGTIKIGVCEFDAGRILRELDEIAFNCAQSEYECKCSDDEGQEGGTQ